MIELTQKDVGEWFLNAEGIPFKCLVMTSDGCFVFEYKRGRANIIKVDNRGVEQDDYSEHEVMSKYTPPQTKDDVAKGMYDMLKDFDTTHKIESFDALNELTEGYETLWGTDND